jgi:hypothetical protein
MLSTELDYIACRDCGTDASCCDDAYPEAGYCCECGPLHRDDPRMYAIGQGTTQRNPRHKLYTNGSLVGIYTADELPDVIARLTESGEVTIQFVRV